jgi:hypothetical protein
MPTGPSCEPSQQGKADAPFPLVIDPADVF